MDYQVRKNLQMYYSDFHHSAELHIPLPLDRVDFSPLKLFL
jgi:hypothetical protein